MTRDEAVIVMQHILHVPMLLKGLAYRVSRYGLFEEWADLQFVWESIHSFYEAYEQAPSKAILLSDIRYRSQDAQGLEDEPARELVSGLYIFTARDRRDTWLSKILEDSFRILIRKRMDAEMESGDTGEEFAERMKLLVRDYGTPPVSTVAYENPFLDVKRYFVEGSSRIPFNIPWM